MMPRPALPFGIAPLAACALAVTAMQASAQNRAQPVPPGVVAHRDLAYVPDGHERQKLDLYLPERTAEEAADAAPLPLVIWVHGGGWRGGSKARCSPLGAGFVTQGYAVASVGYRLTDAAPFPAQIEDCRAAVRWLRAHAEEYGLDPDRFGAWGGSAGGHLVALLGAAGDEATFDVGENQAISARVQAVCDYYGPSDFAAFAASPGQRGRGTRPDSTLYRLFGGPLAEKTDLMKRASPVEYVTKDDPPFLIVHGTADKVVPLDQSERLHAALINAGVSSKLIVIPNAGHATREFHSAETRGAVRAFFDAHLKAPAAE